MLPKQSSNWIQTRKDKQEHRQLMQPMLRKTTLAKLQSSCLDNLTEQYQVRILYLSEWDSAKVLFVDRKIQYLLAIFQKAVEGTLVIV